MQAHICKCLGLTSGKPVWACRFRSCCSLLSVSISDSPVTLSTGNEASLQVAIASKNGLDKLKRVVKSLTKNGHVHTLLFHWFGNYTLQDLVVASSKLRRSAEHMLLKPGQSEAQVAVLQDLIAGRNDLLGTICAGHCRPASD